MTAVPPVYSLYGLRVRSEVELPAPLVESDEPPVDLCVRWGEGQATVGPPPGEVLAELTLPNGRGYVLVDHGRGYTLSFHQTGEFHIARDLRTVRVHLAASADPDLAGLLLAGNVIACILALRGECVLHASAVEVDGAALALLGASGMGKSSLAALLCANGARLVTDDLLRLEPDGQDWLCFPGTGELRLRQDATALLESLPAAGRRATPDDRVAVRLEGGHPRPRLTAIVIPHPSRSCSTLQMERVPPAKSLQYLMAYPRIRESAQRAPLQRRLGFLGQIAATVPLFEAEVPWGMPLPRTMAASLLADAGLALTNTG